METAEGTVIIHYDYRYPPLYANSVALDTPESLASDQRAVHMGWLGMYYKLARDVNVKRVAEWAALIDIHEGFEEILLERDLLGDAGLDARRMEIVEFCRNSRLYAAARLRFGEDAAAAFRVVDAAKAGREALRRSAGPPEGDLEELMMDIDPKNPWKWVEETSRDSRPAKRARR